MLRLRQSSLSLGILALVLWAISWSWLVGVGVTVVRIGEVGALLAGIAAVAVGVTAPRRSQNVGLWCGVAALVLVVGLNLLGLLIGRNPCHHSTPRRRNPSSGPGFRLAERRGRDATLDESIGR